MLTVISNIKGDSMKLLKILIIVLAVLFIVGCGIGDYSYTIGANYKIFASSAYQVSIIPKYGYAYSEENTLPPCIVEVAWNDEYIIAKQYGLKRQDERSSYEVIDYSVVNYWILNMDDKKRYGPFNHEEFKQELEKRNLTSLELKNIDEYR